MNVQDIHGRSLRTSAALSAMQVENVISPLDVIAVLNQASVKFVLVGAHGLGGWMQKPRATQDVEVLVAFPHLEADDDDVVTRLRDRESKEVRIDVMKPKQPLFREALKHTRAVTLEGRSEQI